MPKQNKKAHGRIVSLAASITETLFALDLGSRVVGVTDTCDYPTAVLDLPNIGCWFEPNLETLYKLQPDLVIGLEAAHGDLTVPLEAAGIGLELIGPATVEQAIGTIADLGEMLEAANREEVVKRLHTRLETLDTAAAQIDSDDRSTACRILEFYEGKVYVAGPLSFQYDVIRRAGGVNVTNDLGSAYPRITLEMLAELDPDLIFYCGYNLEYFEKMKEMPIWRSLKAVEKSRVHRFPCELTCRFGPRIVDMAELLHRTLYG